MGKMKRIIPNIIVAVMLIGGIGLLAYPTISDCINELHSSRAIGSYVKKTKDLSKEKKAQLLSEARAYNATLVNKKNRYFLKPEEKEQYSKLLDVTDTGIMGYVDIPKIKAYIPIYHGVDAGSLQIATGHIPGSSLPVGGPSTHSLISGHTGLLSAKLFTNIDQLEDGDIFMIHVFDDVYAYKVNKINTVLPDEVEDLEIEKGKDYVTLITCTPYGVNSHRLLVRGERTKYTKTQNVADVIRMVMLKYIAILAVGVITLIVLIRLYIKRRRKKKGIK